MFEENQCLGLPFTSPFNLIYWGHGKESVSGNSFKVTSLHQLKGIISGATSTDFTQDMLIHIWQKLNYELNVCLAAIKLIQK